MADVTLLKRYYKAKSNPSQLRAAQVNCFPDDRLKPLEIALTYTDMAVTEKSVPPYQP